MPHCKVYTKEVYIHSKFPKSNDKLIIIWNVKLKL